MSDGVVLDASVTLRWLLRDVPGPEQKVKSDLELGFAVVPALWHYEVANGLRNAVRAGRLSIEVMSVFADELEAYDIRTDAMSMPIRRLSIEADLHGLTAYDVSYLLLARDRELPLATLDNRLTEAARTAGVRLAI